ncbi:vomeronasal type-1 receptor 4-like [Ctenodactylus gundi]
MTPRALSVGIFSAFQTGAGTLSNASLLFFYLLSELSGKTLTPKDLILKHLTLANSLAIISRGIPQTMAEFGLTYFLGDLGCKLVFYVYRVSRGVSLYATCLLSCFQAATISASNSRWGKIKSRVTRCLGPSCLLSWLMNLLLNIMVPLRVMGPRHGRNITGGLNFGYCSGFLVTPLFVVLLCCSDGLCLGLMAWASGSMANVLCRHTRRVQYIQGAQKSPRVLTEARATRTILILVSTFVTLYSVSSFLVLYVALFAQPSPWLINVLALVETCFPTFCPLVLTNSNTSAFRIYFSPGGKR